MLSPRMIQASIYPYSIFLFFFFFTTRLVWRYLSLKIDAIFPLLE
jgi:hypothetical protein